MFERVVEFIEQLNTLKEICIENKISVNLLNFNDVTYKSNQIILYKTFLRFKKDNTVYVRNLYSDSLTDNQYMLYLFDLSNQKFLRFVDIRNSNSQIYRGFINDYNRSFEQFRRYWQQHKQEMIVDFVEHFNFTLKQVIEQSNQSYYSDIRDIYNKLKTVDQNIVYNKFFNNRKLYLPILFYLSDTEFNIIESNTVNVYFTYKVELNINLAQKVTIKSNSILPISDIQKFEKLVDILYSKKIIDDRAKNYFVNRLDKTPMFNDFVVENDIVKIRLVDYMDARLLPYLFILNALYCKKNFA